MQISSELLNLPSFCTVFHYFLIDLAVEEHLSDTKKSDSPHFVCCSVRAGADMMACSGSKAVFAGFALILFVFISWIYLRHLTYSLLQFSEVRLACMHVSFSKFDYFHRY